jgi:hypothetical protein
VLLSVVKLCAKQNFIVGKLEGLHPACVPVVVASNLELRAVFAIETHLEYECLTLLEDHLDLLDVWRQFADLGGRLLSALALLAIDERDA